MGALVPHAVTGRNDDVPGGDDCVALGLGGARGGRNGAGEPDHHVDGCGAIGRLRRARRDTEGDQVALGPHARPPPVAEAGVLAVEPNEPVVRGSRLVGLADPCRDVESRVTARRRRATGCGDGLGDVHGRLDEAGESRHCEHPGCRTGRIEVVEVCGEEAPVALRVRRPVDDQRTGGDVKREGPPALIGGDGQPGRRGAGHRVGDDDRRRFQAVRVVRIDVRDSSSAGRQPCSRWGSSCRRLRTGFTTCPVGTNN